SPRVSVVGGGLATRGRCSAQRGHGRRRGRHLSRDRREDAPGPAVVSAEPGNLRRADRPKLTRATVTQDLGDINGRTSSTRVRSSVATADLPLVCMIAELESGFESRSGGEQGMTAHAGDLIVVESERVTQPVARGVIEEV